MLKLIILLSDNLLQDTQMLLIALHNKVYKGQYIYNTVLCDILQ